MHQARIGIKVGYTIVRSAADDGIIRPSEGGVCPLPAHLLKHLCWF
jgi:hypothetical protein